MEMRKDLKKRATNAGRSQCIGGTGAGEERLLQVREDG